MIVWQVQGKSIEPQVVMAFAEQRITLWPEFLQMAQVWLGNDAQVECQGLPSRAVAKDHCKIHVGCTR